MWFRKWNLVSITLHNSATFCICLHYFTSLYITRSAYLHSTLCNSYILAIFLLMYMVLVTDYMTQFIKTYSRRSERKWKIRFNTLHIVLCSAVMSLLDSSVIVHIQWCQMLPTGKISRRTLLTMGISRKKRAYKPNQIFTIGTTPQKRSAKRHFIMNWCWLVRYRVTIYEG